MYKTSRRNNIHQTIFIMPLTLSNGKHIMIPRQRLKDMRRRGTIGQGGLPRTHRDVFIKFKEDGKVIDEITGTADYDNRFVEEIADQLTNPIVNHTVNDFGDTWEIESEETVDEKKVNFQVDVRVEVAAANCVVM